MKASPAKRARPPTTPTGIAQFLVFELDEALALLLACNALDADAWDCETALCTDDAMDSSTVVVTLIQRHKLGAAINAIRLSAKLTLL